MFTKGEAQRDYVNTSEASEALFLTYTDITWVRCLSTLAWYSQPIGGHDCCSSGKPYQSSWMYFWPRAKIFKTQFTKEVYKKGDVLLWTKHLGFTVRGHKQTYTHLRVQYSPTSVGFTQACPMICNLGWLLLLVWEFSNNSSECHSTWFLLDHAYICWAGKPIHTLVHMVTLQKP